MKAATSRLPRRLIAVTLMTMCSGGRLPALAAAADPEAGPRWEVDYGVGSCRLIRHMGTADRDDRLEVKRSWSFTGYDWTLYGPDVPSYSSATTITIALQPSASTHHFKTNPYMAADDSGHAVAWNDPDGLIIAALGKDHRISVTGTKNLKVAFDLPNAADAIKALEACEDDLVASWGFDPQQIRSLSGRPEPANNAARWATNDDYPPLDLARKNEGTTTFLLGIDADGAVTGCRILVSSGFASLDKRTCALLFARAAFRPVRNAAGVAVPAFYVNKIRWRTPR